MLIVAWLAWMLRDIVILMGFAALIAYALDPIVSLAQRVRLAGHRLPRTFASGAVIVVLGIIAGWSLAAAIPRLVARLEQEGRRFADSYGWGGFADQIGAGDTASLVSRAAQQWSMQLV